MDFGMDNAHTFCSRFNSPYNIPSKPKPEKNSSGEQSSGYVNYGSYFKNQNQEELTTTKQKKRKSENRFEHRRGSKSRKAVFNDAGEMESTETSPNFITEYVSNMEKEPINIFKKLKDELQPFTNKKNQSQKLGNTTPQENYAGFAGKVQMRSRVS